MKNKVLNINQLEELSKVEKNPRLKDRLKALHLLSKGVKVKTICSVFDIHEDVLLYRWLPIWNKGGIKELADKPHLGRTPFLQKEHRQALRDYVLSKDKRVVCKDLVFYVKEKWSIDCNEETIRKVLKNMKLSWQKPDKINHKAKEEEKEVFLKGTRWCKV